MNPALIEFFFFYKLRSNSAQMFLSVNNTALYYAPSLDMMLVLLSLEQVEMFVIHFLYMGLINMCICYKDNYYMLLRPNACKERREKVRASYTLLKCK